MAGLFCPPRKLKKVFYLYHQDYFFRQFQVKSFFDWKVTTYEQALAEVPGGFHATVK